MRNESLTAYSLHQRPFQDKRSIYYLLTKEHGVLHGIAKKGIPQFSPLTLFATGKKSLKTFQQVTMTGNVPTLSGAQQYAALYINEITLKLLPLEDKVPDLYYHYHQVIHCLQQTLSNEELRLALRTYEHALFEELGFAVDLVMDCYQNAIDKQQLYSFGANVGWMPIHDKSEKEKDLGSPNLIDSGIEEAIETSMAKSNVICSNPTDINLSRRADTSFIVSGSDIIKMQEGVNGHTIKYWTPIHKQVVDFLFDYKPLQSRILWQQYQRYQ